jgi:O-antigen ligase
MKLIICIIIEISFLVEYTLESQVGVLIRLFFILLAGAPVTANLPEPAPI